MSTDDALSALSDGGGGAHAAAAAAGGVAGCGSSVGVSDPIGWYSDAWHVMHDDKRDEALLNYAKHAVGVPSSVGAMPLLRLLAAEAAASLGSESAALHGEAASAPSWKLKGDVVSALLAHPLQFFGLVHNRAPAALETLPDVAAALLAARERADLAAVLLPVLVAAATHLPAVASTDGRLLPMALKCDGLVAVCAIVRAAPENIGIGAGVGHGLAPDPRRAAVRHGTAFLAALARSHSANTDAADGVLAHLQADGLLNDVIREARASPGDEDFACEVAAIVQWLGSLDNRRHATPAAAVLSAAGAVEWLAAALFAAEGAVDSLVLPAAAAPATVVGGSEGQASAVSLHRLVKAAREVANGPLGPDLVASGAAASLMRLATLLAGHGQHERLLYETQQALGLLHPRAASVHEPGKVGSAQAQAVRLAVAARVHTWRRRRHAVAAWAHAGATE